MFDFSTPGAALVSLINLAYLPFFTWLSYYVGKKKNFDPIVCIICGLLFQWITVIVLACLKPKSIDK